MIAIDKTAAARDAQGNIRWVPTPDRTIFFERFARAGQAGLFCWIAFDNASGRKLTAALETLAAAQMAAAEEISEPTLAELAARLRARDAREAATPKPARKHETLWDRQNYGQGLYHG